MQFPLKCVVIDDEPLAIQVLEKHIAAMPQLVLDRHFQNPLLAFEYVQQTAIDLVFLDIHMPVLTGMDFVRSLPKQQAVIFTTAYRDFAVESYELDVADYLLKPITFTRFFRAVNKYINQVQDNPQANTVPKPATATGEADFIYVNSNKKHIKIAFSQILYVESIKDYIRIHTTDKRVVTKEKISDFADKLPASNFVRIHRSYIINLRKMTAFSAHEVEIGDQEIPIGASYKKLVWERLKS